MKTKDDNEIYDMFSTDTKTSTLLPETEEQRAARIADEKSVASAFGFDLTDNEELIDKKESLSDILPLQKYVQEVERANKIKAANAGVYETISLLSDIISAGVGGNVYQRDKNTIAKDAIADTQAKKLALQQAELAQKEKDRKRLLDAQNAVLNIRFKHANMRDRMWNQIKPVDASDNSTKDATGTSATDNTNTDVKTKNTTSTKTINTDPLAKFKTEAGKIMTDIETDTEDKLAQIESLLKVHPEVPYSMGEGIMEYLKEQIRKEEEEANKGKKPKKQKRTFGEWFKGLFEGKDGKEEDDPTGGMF